MTGEALLSDGHGKRYDIPVSVDVTVVGQALNGAITVGGSVTVAVSVDDSAAGGALKASSGKTDDKGESCRLKDIEGRSCVYRCGADRHRREFPVAEQQPIVPGDAAHPYCAQFLRLF